MRTATFSKLLTVVGGTFLYAGNPALAKRDQKNNLRALADDVDQSMPMEAVDPASSGGTAETEVSEWFSYSSLLLGHASTTEILEHLEADGRDVKGVCEELFPAPPLCDCSFTKGSLESVVDWGEGCRRRLEGGDDVTQSTLCPDSDDFCDANTGGWGYDVCLQLTKDQGKTNVEATTGKITLYSPSSQADCENTQEKIVCDITKFRMTPSFPGAAGDGSNNEVYFTATGTAYYDDNVSVSDSTPGVFRSCAVGFGVGDFDALSAGTPPSGTDPNVNVNGFAFALLNVAVDDSWIYTAEAFPAIVDRYRVFLAPYDFPGNLQLEMTTCGLYDSAGR